MNKETADVYTCPMHPEIRREGPGRCPKCGMELVLQGQAPTVSDKGLGPLTWRSYLPLVLIIMSIFVASVLLSFNNFSVQKFISYFMGVFFITFATFKFIDLPGFAHGYFTYDLLAQRAIWYGYVYPFVELIFGLLMLAGYQSAGLLWSEFGVMAFSGLGVALKLAKHEQFQCVCLGTFLKVPLTKVTLVEDFGMTLLALILIFY